MQRALRFHFSILTYVWTVEQITNRLLNECLEGREEKPLEMFFFFHPQPILYLLTARTLCLTKGSSPERKIAQMGFIQALVNTKIATNRNKKYKCGTTRHLCFCKIFQKIHFVKQKMHCFLEVGEEFEKRHDNQTAAVLKESS